MSSSFETVLARLEKRADEERYVWTQVDQSALLVAELATGTLLPVGSGVELSCVWRTPAGVTA